MEITELTSNTLAKYLDDYKDYQLITMLVFVFLMLIIQFSYSMLLTRKIEKFKAILSKSEIKFSRYHNLQVDALRAIYDKLVRFGYANSVLFNSEYNLNNHIDFIKRIDNWSLLYIECVKEFSKEKILLPQRLKSLVSHNLSNFEFVNNAISKVRNELLLLEESVKGDFSSIYSNEEEELSLINERIDSLRKNMVVNESANNINGLRQCVEEYFEEMNK